MRSPFSPLHLLAFIALLVFLLILVQFGLVALAFGKLGLSTSQGMLLLFVSLFGSALNLPILSIKAEKPEIEPADAKLRRLLQLPSMPFTGQTLIAMNVGGCLVPVVFSASLIHRFQFPVQELLPTIGIVATVCYAFSRPLPGIGIGMPPLIAPIAAALVALLINHEMAAPLAYVGGTMGVLIGADLLRMRDVARLGAPIASIGGAGTFDGIFLTGIVAVLLA